MKMKDKASSKMWLCNRQGANVVVGESTPVRGIVDALGHAAIVLINEQQASGLAIPSLTVVKNGITIVYVGAEDTAIATAASKGLLYGAYHNYLSTDGVSALWNGIISSLQTAGASAIPAVVVDGVAATAVNPNNLANPASQIIFVDSSAPKGAISEEEAVKR